MSEGFLNAQETLRFTGRPLNADARATLPDQMDRFHFAAVTKSVFGVIRCRIQPRKVDCNFFGWWPALVFGAPETSVEERKVTRQWRIEGGILSRPSPPVFGTITFGWECGEGEGPNVPQSLWVCVEGYPSRLLAAPSNKPKRRIGVLIGSVYAWYHGLVTCRYLKRMAHYLTTHANTPPANVNTEPQI